MRAQLDDLTIQLDAKGTRYERINSDSSDGASLVELYDAVAYPAVLVLRDDGQMVKMWQGMVPTSDDVSQHYGIESQ